MNDNCSTPLALGDGLMFPGTNCASPATGTCESTGATFYVTNITTTGMHTISVTSTGSASFVVGALGATCSGTAIGACGPTISVDVTTTGQYYWMVQSVSGCGGYMAGMD